MNMASVCSPLSNVKIRLPLGRVLWAQTPFVLLSRSPPSRSSRGRARRRPGIALPRGQCLVGASGADVAIDADRRSRRSSGASFGQVSGESCASIASPQACTPRACNAALGRRAALVPSTSPGVYNDQVVAYDLEAETSYGSTHEWSTSPTTSAGGRPSTTPPGIDDISFS